MSAQAGALVSLAAYGAELAKQQGQAALARIAIEAGADGVEYRGELLRPQDGWAELREAAGGRAIVWSSADGLWAQGGTLDVAALERAFAAAQALGASRVKMALGAYSSTAPLEALQPWFRRRDAQLVIENDQTASAGTVTALQGFFSRIAALGANVPMTFDMGNWHWAGEDPLDAATRLGAQVGYIHCKGVQRLPAKWVAVPLEDSAAPWRRVLRQLPAGVPRAIEFPLQGDDLVATTRRHLAVLREAEGAL